MHTYLRSIGFSKLNNKKDIDAILEEVVKDYDEKIVVEAHPDHLFAEMSKNYGCDCGITVCGQYDEMNEFHIEYYFPYFRGTGVTTHENVMIERHAQKESFAGACDDPRVGLTLIFYIQNTAEYLNAYIKDQFYVNNPSVTFSGLAKEGKILLPIKKDKAQVQIAQDSMRNRSQLIEEAREGNEEAIESLTIEDIDTYTMVSRRIKTEDVFSIVDTYFMPYGMECDQYSVLGEILECMEFKNIETGEDIYQMTIETNDMQFDVCINSKDLYGEPKVGRRFKGSIWLQGQLNF